MDKRLMPLLLSLGFIGNAAWGDLRADLAAHWQFEEGSGTTAADSSGNGHDGTFNGAPQWAEGLYGGAIDFRHANTNECVVVPPFEVIGGGITLAAWVKPRSFAQADARIIDKGRDVAAADDAWWMLSPVSSGGQIRLRFRLKTNQNATTTTQIATAGGLTANEWNHMAAVWDGTSMIVYEDGVEVGRVAKGGTAVATNPDARIFIGNQLAGVERRPFDGLIDDACVFSRGLTVEEIQELMAGLSRESAAQPSPADRQRDVPRDVVLNWTAGEFAAAHDVYFGTEFTEVEAADRATPGGVLVSRGQTATTFEPEGLEYGRTYFWRVDEVGGPPDSTLFPGTVWSFTVEPYGYPIVNLTATASSAQTGMGPENTINRSGLNASDEHSNDLTDMWMSAGATPNWIQYEFDKVYKLHELRVWNSNQLIEAFIGFGARNVTIEYSTDGQTWATLDGVPEFAQGTGAPTYAANTVVSFDGVTARYVKLTIDKPWGVAPQTGLSEVRFLYVPAQAFAPEPANDITSVAIDAELSWRPGREAQSHEVYFGTDEAALALADTVAERRYTPTSLDFGTTYFWKINEVGGDGPYEGEVWSFTTQEYATVEDFEGYNDDDNRIYDVWIDGLTDAAKGGSQVGYDVSPFAEKLVVHGGKQSMPLMYDNSASPFISEAERTFDTPQNWTGSGADTLSLYVRGGTPAFAETPSGSVFMNAIGADIWGNADQFRYAYKTLNGNGTMVARVESTFNSNVWAKGGVMIRQSIEPGSVHAFMPITPGGSGAGNGASFQHRLTANGASTNNDNTTPVVAAPYWVKIERNGNSFTGAISPDGQTWKQLGGAQTITMTGPVLIGLALCSHDAAIATAAEFSNIAFTGNVSGNWQVAEIGVAQPAGNSVEGLYVTVKDSSGKSASVANADSAATVRGGWTQWKIPLSEFTAAGVKINAVTSMTIGVGNKTSPTAGGAGTLFIDDIGYGRPAMAQ